MSIIHDHHIHTIYSGHSAPDMLVGAIVDRVNRSGLKRVVILEHVPESPKYKKDIASRRSNDFPMPQIDAIREEVRQWRGRCAARIFVGAEIDADPFALDGSLLAKKLAGVDVVLGSTHFLPGKGIYWYEAPKPLPPQMAEEVYSSWMTWMMYVAANPSVNVLAHPGAEMANIGAIADFSGKVLEDFEKLLLVCKKYRTAFELNENFPKKAGEDKAESYIDVIALARDLGVQISIGSDSHSLKELGGYKWVESVADKLGLNSSHFYNPGV